jgi:hypothetical protein
MLDAADLLLRRSRRDRIEEIIHAMRIADQSLHGPAGFLHHPGSCLHLLEAVRARCLDLAGSRCARLRISAAALAKPRP